jgi:hypothetical protein
MINGSSRGWEGNPNGEGAFAFLNQLAWVNNGTVIIGDATTNDEDKGPVILGSIYGGGENGHNFKDAVVRMYKGTVGNSDPSANTYNCGNVYGAGCGTDTYWDDANGNSVKDPGEELYNPLAGVVRGNATVIVKGGHVLRNVYGAGAMGSVGNEEEAEGSSTSGKTTVTITGNAKIGADDGNGNIYGAARGDLNVQKENFANVRATEVEINGNADIKGSVFGGGEAGIVWEGVTVNMLGGTVPRTSMVAVLWQTRSWLTITKETLRAPMLLPSTSRAVPLTTMLTAADLERQTLWTILVPSPQMVFRLWYMVT